MKFLVTFVSIDTTGSNALILSNSATSRLQHEIVHTDSPEYSACESIRDIEVAFETIHNYIHSNDVLARPQSKFKVLTVEALPREPESANARSLELSPRLLHS
jgi:hypothetical protein